MNRDQGQVRGGARQSCTAGGSTECLTLTETLECRASSGWSTTESSTSCDGRVAAALEEYLAALKVGNPPDREAFLDRHREISQELGECISGLEMVHIVGWQLGAEPTRLSGEGLDAPELPATARLGDYRIIGELGRGSMGVVYEAEQISLGRRVALKVLPLSSAIDPRRRQRFLVEAQAAAQLHHPHIVPVFAAGCEGGVHFYALMCERLFGRRPTKVQLIYLGAHPQIIETVPTAQSITGVERKLTAIWAAVERACEREDFRPKPSALCNWCSFKEWCPAFGGDPALAPGTRVALREPLATTPAPSTLPQPAA